MAKKLFSLIAVFGLASTLLVQSMATVNAQEPVSSNQPNPRLVESSDQGLVLELSVPKFQFNQLFSDIGPCQQINLEGWGVIGDAGEPSLPVKGTLVGLPIGSGLNAEVIDIGPALVLEGVDLCPAATPTESYNPQDIPDNFGEQLIINREYYSIDRNYPDQLIEVGPAAIIRSQQVARVLIKPFQYNPVKRQLSYFNRIKVEVKFENTTISMPLHSYTENHLLQEL